MRQAGLIFRRRTCRREDGHGRRGLSSAEELVGGRMDAAGGAYLPPKSLPERGWMRQAGLTFRRRTCRGGRMDAAGGAYLPPKSLPRREDGHGRRGLPSAKELAEAGGWMRQARLTFRRRTCRGRRMDTAGGAYLPPKSLPRREASDETAGLPPVAV